MFLFFRKFFFVIVISFVFSFFADTKVFAFSLFPLRQTFVVDPGQSMDTFIDVKNDGVSAQEFVFDVDAFSLNEKTGKIQFGKKDVSLGWFQISPSSTILEGGQSKRIHFVLKVPEETKSGMYPLALVAIQKNTGGQIGISTRIASLLFLHVSGKIEEKMEIENFSFQKKISFLTPVFFDYTLKNTGNTYVVPEGFLAVQSFWGEEMTSFPINLQKQKLLGGENFVRTEHIKELPWYAIGKMKAVLNFKYGISGQIEKEEIAFWYFSWKMLFLVGSILFIGLNLWIFRKKAKF